MVGAFLLLLPYRVPSRGLWKSHGAFLGFVIALMTEMFGWPLLLLLLSPLVDVPIIAYPYMKLLGHNGPAGIGTAVSLLGLGLVVAGWAKIHRAEGLVTTGIYRWVRHPQYTGLILFTFGWIIHWPSLITMVLWPLLSAAYVGLALAEEREAAMCFGAEYRAYSAATPRRFLPFIV
jgi:protein-S-isoprenylcysteine O-methyltransferase Ste14